MAREKICGIYQIRNLVNGKVYIGSSKNTYERWRIHRARLKLGKHPNPHLQHTWNKYGKESFSFEIIEEVDISGDLLEREQGYLDNVVRWGFDYNIAKKAGKPPDATGRTASFQTIAKRSGENHWAWGTEWSDKQKKISSESQKGNKSHRWGKKASSETLEKMSLSQSGEAGWASKLVNNDVIQIRKMWKTKKYTYAELGKIFGVHRRTIWDIVHRKTWKHI